jgi:hypothetical protein
MPVHSFGVDVGQSGDDRFTTAHTDFRSDAEQRFTPLAIHNPDSNDLKLARKLADEIVHVSGAEVKIYTRTENPDYDGVWDSDPDPTYWACVPMKGYFKPMPMEFELKKWGAEAVNKTEIIFSHRQLFEQFGERMLRAGDVIQVPYNAATEALAPKNYRVENGAPSGNYRYHWLYFTCHVELLTADVTVRPDDDLPMVQDQAQPGGTFRESV